MGTDLWPPRAHALTRVRCVLTRVRCALMYVQAHGMGFLTLIAHKPD